MSARPTVEFWYDFASTYSYPAAATVEGAAEALGVGVAWRPFLLGPLFNSQQGLRDSPFNVQPAKGAHMWRDLERICARLGLPWRRPSAFPRNSLLAVRTAAALPDAQRPTFTRAVYRTNFAEDRDIADPQVLGAALTEAGADPATALEAAASEATKAAVRAATDEAMARGLFGAPSFTTPDGELFWGFDRMDEALGWAVEHPQS